LPTYLLLSKAVRVYTSLAGYVKVYPQDCDGFLKIVVPVFTLPNGTAKSAKHAKFSDFLGDLRGSKLLSAMNLRKPWQNCFAYPRGCFAYNQTYDPHMEAYNID
jgi:hypothetical protein